MENIGLSTRETQNGHEAIEIFEAWRPQLIWMDRRMPVMDGLTATRRIRSLPGGDQVKIIALTASAFQDEKAEVLEAGSDDFLCKPYHPDEIYDCLTKHLGVRYVYAERVTESLETTPSAVVLTSEALATLPVALRGELYEAALLLHPESVLAAIEHIREIDPELATDLALLAQHFRYDRILELLNQNVPTSE